MKAFTDIEQSKKLAEILPLESADMSWVSNGLGKPFARTIPIKGDPEELCACWSLAALISIIPNYKLNSEHNYHTCTAGTNFGNESVGRWYDNPIDACYEMVIKLNELNLL